MKSIWNKILLFNKEKGYGYSIEDLEYPKDLILKLKYENDLVNKTYNTPLLTNYGSEGSFKDGNRATIL